MRIKSIRQIKDLKGQRVLVRCDFDLPLARRGLTRTGARTNADIIKDDSRLRACLPTVEYLLKKKANIILMGHLGRPKGKVVSELSLMPVKKRLERLLRVKGYLPCSLPRGKAGKAGKAGGLLVTFIKDLDNRIPRFARDKLVAILENLRFWPGEEKNEKKFAKKLASLGDIYVNEAFAVSHRHAASVDAIQNYLLSYAGLHLEKEIKNLEAVMRSPKHSLVLIIGGAKIETKLPVIKNFLQKADYILIGGAVANNFLKAQGYEVGKSLVDEEYLSEATEIIKALKPASRQGGHKNIKTKIILPIDVVIKSKIINQKSEIRKIDEVKNNEHILDIGPKTIMIFNGIIKKARTVVWNGPLGYFEDKKFAKGTFEITRTILNSKARVIMGGGETVEAVKKEIRNKKLEVRGNVFISTGGGAMLEYLAGKSLPGLRTLIRRG